MCQYVEVILQENAGIFLKASHFEANITLHYERFQTLPQHFHGNYPLHPRETFCRLAQLHLDHEMIVYSHNFTAAERIVAENYLSAKYNRPLIVNDVYDGITNSNRDCDFSVAGIV
jgi:hypothetical protein